MAIIEVQHVYKTYPARRGARDLRGRGGLGDWLRGSKTGTFDALHDINLDINAGETLGIIGKNGSGKSTLLKLLAGVTLPTRGRVLAHGRVASLLELGAGFNPILTGRENIFLNAGLLGMRHAQTREVLEEIIAFSGIREFIDQPVDTYSSGMYVRIAFSVAVHVNPDIFLVDEVLAVGDEEFQRKCRHKIGELREQGKTIVFVSHDLGTVHALCDRVVLLNAGETIARGSTQETINYYLRQVGRANGIHAMRNGGLEAVFTHGRIALYKDQHEISAPSGMTAVFHSLGQPHLSSEAESEVTERFPDRCAAVTPMPRLPVKLLWDIRVTEETVILRLALDCLREVDIETLACHLALPASFTAWNYGEREGAFPDIQPGQTEWSLIAGPQPGYREAVLQTAAGAAPPVKISFSERDQYANLFFCNSDYMTGARIATCQVSFPRAEMPLRPGRREIAEITIDFGLSAASIAAWRDTERARRTVTSGPFAALVHAGHAELFWKGKPISAMVHLHTQLRISDMWLGSYLCRWERPTRDGDALLASGESQRFPFKQHWRLTPIPGGFHFEAELEALKLLSVQEYNVSIGLIAAYAHWDLAGETGVFPPIPETQTDWWHLNQSYAQSPFMRATGPDLPTVTVRPDPEGIAFRMTALNSEYFAQTHILQAIRQPEHTAQFLFEPGRHPLFSGDILLES